MASYTPGPPGGGGALGFEMQNRLASNEVAPAAQGQDNGHYVPELPPIIDPIQPTPIPQPRPPPIGFVVQGAYPSLPPVQGDTDVALLGYRQTLPTEQPQGDGSHVLSVEPQVGNKSEEDEESSEKRHLVSPAVAGHGSAPTAPWVKAPNPDLFFKSDPKKRVDYILTFTVDDTGEKRHKRQVFEENLEKDGLVLERVDANDSRDRKTFFVKVHLPWDTLTQYAEVLKIKMPLKENDIDIESESIWQMCCSKVPNIFALDEEVVKPEKSYFTAAFDKNRMDQFIIGDPENFFTNAQRSRIVYWIMQRTPYERPMANEQDTKSKFGIKRLLNNGAYAAAFPLNEGDYSSPHSVYASGPDNDRHLLYEVWARPKNFYKFQPLDQIRQYYGEKIAIYFCWLGYYTTALIPAALVGLVAFFYGIVTLASDKTSQEICDGSAEGGDMSRSGDLIMCPMCDVICPYWRLSLSCTYARFTYLFDNYATVAFAAFMVIWATFFHEFWKRRQAEIDYDWDVANFEAEEETVRPEFEASVTNMRKNLINDEDEPFLPILSKLIRYCTSAFVILFMLLLVVAAVFGVIIYRIIVTALLYGVGEPVIQSRAKILTTATAAVINLIIIIILNVFYTRVAKILTNLEKPRTDTEWEDSFTLKMFLFQFVNYYSTIFYIAFFKGRFGGNPGHYDYSLTGSRQEECDPAGCLIELCIQLAIVMIGKQTFNNFKELILPKLVVWYKSRRINQDGEKSSLHQWEKDNVLAPAPAFGLFDEYLEMVIQFGFVTIFVAAFPLAPLFALINNIIEIRLDAYKFTTQWRRPLATRSQDIGAWFGILRGISAIAIVTNAFIIALTSDFIPKLTYLYLYKCYDTGSDCTFDMSGYVNHSLSYFSVADFQNQTYPRDIQIEKFGNVSYCRYRDNREPPWDDKRYSFTLEFWHIFALRLTFVIIFENAVVFFTWFIGYLVPDVPRPVKIQMLREKHLAEQAILEASRATSKIQIDKQD